jgi:hypothetical protein
MRVFQTLHYQACSRGKSVFVIATNAGRQGAFQGEQDFQQTQPYLKSDKLKRGIQTYMTTSPDLCDDSPG